MRLVNNSKLANSINSISVSEDTVTPAAPVTGKRKIYAKNDGKLYHVGSDAVEKAVGSGSGTGVNYITNPDAEGVDATGWITYKDVGATATVSNVAIASNEVTTASAHGYSIGDSVYFSAVGGITGLSALVRYYVVSASSTTKLGFALTRGGTIITCSGTVSGSPVLTKIDVVDGTGGSSIGTAISLSATNSLVGVKSFALSTYNSSLNSAGHGWSFLMAINNNDLGRVLGISFDLRNISASLSTINLGDLEVWIYDVTNSVLIQPTPYQVGGMVYSASTLNYSYYGTFQTNTTSTSYRLILHWTNPAAAISTMTVDNFSVGPLVKSVAPIISPITTESFVVGATTTAPTLGTSGTAIRSWYRDGQHLVATYKVYSGSASWSAGSGVYKFPLPSGLFLDTSILSDATTAGWSGSVTSGSTQLTSGLVGVTGLQPVGQYLSNGPTGFGIGGFAFMWDTSNFAVAVASDGVGTTNNDPFVVGSAWESIASVRTFGITIRIPIAGWGSSQQFSNIDDGRVVSAITTGSGGVSTGASSVAANTPLKPAIIVEDTHAGWNLSTGIYTIPVSGRYYVSIINDMDCGTCVPYLIINGVNTNSDKVGIGFFASGASGGAGAGSSTFNLKAGDQISFALTNPITSVGNGNKFSIFKIGGSSQVLPAEKVFADYSFNFSVAAPLNSGVVFGTTGTYTATKYEDSHNAVSFPSNGYKFTAPRNGVYRFEVGWNWNGSTGYLVALINPTLNVYTENDVHNVDQIFAQPDGATSRRHYSYTQKLKAGDVFQLGWRGGAATSTGGSLYYIRVESNG